ncbi:MAG: head GIN domain-containing protein [Bacteroidota bacterium]
MMTKTNWILLLFACLLLGPGCVIDIDDNDDDGAFDNCISGRGETISREVSMAEFIGIKLEIDAEVFVTQGNTQSVLIEAEQNIFNLIELDVQNDIWEIEFDECVRDYDDIQIFITLPTIRLLSIAGSGLIRGENLFEVNRIDLDILGSGDIDVAIDALEVDAEIAGSGKMFLEGNAEEFDFETSGSGDFRAFDLSTQEGKVELNGSGDAEVQVANLLDIEINGSGDVYYRGFPALDVQISGSGRVVNAN